MKTFKQYISEVIIVPKKRKPKEKSKMYVPPTEKGTQDKPEPYSYDWYKQQK